MCLQMFCKAICFSVVIGKRRFCWSARNFTIRSIVGISSTEYEDFTSDGEGLLIENGDANENKTEIEERETLPGFGSAHIFMPIPNTGTVVASHCEWQFRYNFVENRIPQTITEVMCMNSGDSCGNSRYFACRQVKAKMQVTYGLRVSEDGIIQTDGELGARNITVNIGCSCSYFLPIMFQGMDLIEEKRRRRK